MADRYFPPMKTWAEIQKAHDTLATIVLNPDLRDEIVHSDWVDQVVASLDVLCWVLGHANTRFPDALSGVEEKLRDLGYVMKELPGEVAH